MTTTAKNPEFKVDVDAEERASHWLAEANEARERGNNVKEEKCLAKGQFWLDRANKRRGWRE